MHLYVCVCACVREQGKRKAGRSTVVIRCADSWFYVEPRLPGWKSTEMNWRPRYQPLRHMVAPINLSLQTEAHMTTYTPTRASLTYSCAVNIEACLATLWIQAHGQGFISIFRLYSFHKHVSEMITGCKLLLCSYGLWTGSIDWLQQMKCSNQRLGPESPVWTGGRSNKRCWFPMVYFSLAISVNLSQTQCHTNQYTQMVSVSVML